MMRKARYPLLLYSLQSSATQLRLDGILHAAKAQGTAAVDGRSHEQVLINNKRELVPARFHESITLECSFRDDEP